MIDILSELNAEAGTLDDDGKETYVSGLLRRAAQEISQHRHHKAEQDETIRRLKGTGERTRA